MKYNIIISKVRTSPQKFNSARSMLIIETNYESPWFKCKKIDM